MNILFLCDEYPPGRHGGIGTATQLLARALVQQGHRVVVAGFADWGYEGEDVFADEGVQVFRYRRRLAGSFFSKRDSIRVRAAYKLLKGAGAFQRDIEMSLKGYERFVRELIRRFEIELIEMPDYNEYIQFCNRYVPFPRFPVPVVVKLHGTITYFHQEAGEAVPPHFYRMEHDILHAADAVSSVSAYTARQTAQYFDYRKPIAVLYNGIHTGRAGSPAAPVPGTVVFSGSLLRKKGIFQLMEAWNEVSRRMPHARLQVFGKGARGPVEALLREDARSTVIFRGHVDRPVLQEALAGADAAVFPSYSECFALGPMEAMAAGAAVVYTTRTSGPELITDGVDGLLADPEDVSGLADRICLLLADRSLRDRIAAAGQEKVRRLFDIQTIAAHHIGFYRGVLHAALTGKP